MLFSGDQMVYGSYGGAEGRPVGETNGLIYGYYLIDVCQQSPMVIQFQSSVPFRTNTIDGNAVIDLDLYNRVLGYGKSQCVGALLPDPYEPVILLCSGLAAQVPGDEVRRPLLLPPYTEEVYRHKKNLGNVVTLLKLLLIQLLESTVSLSVMS